MVNEDNIVKLGDWIIHQGRSPRGDGSYSRDPVRLLEMTEYHMVVYDPNHKFSHIIAREDFPNWTLASPLMVECALQHHNPTERAAIPDPPKALV